MSALLRFIPAGARKWLLIGFALLIVAGILSRVFGGASLGKGVLIIGLVAILALAALWVLIHFATRAARKRKQRTFDASLAAKEGIEDRKREWQSWVEELEKADIDRYELPFYLLLGEPQSGKSILLQNSDLHFLFGQNRLSGVGGTRGCDWWFTQEAVILDLAGRLFTHEGGAADEAEWAAFLDLLNSFRPMDPANGIMLVIPCDSLLTDSLETSRKKASQIREALFTLSRTLEAKLPIYVILTKGDKIFGFAETVHRLEAEQRKQMFGWSRPVERLEHPFQSEELGEAWDGFVESATSLRDSMLATARIPEAIPEVDRMMAFPSELKGLYLAVEAYMTRIFQGSDLLDQLYFRGIYLTSGLQSGAPIAKVGLEILDRPGDADNRDLETMFVRQQAYFIRDLVRKRVFAERGLVRPTGARTKRVQKNAWVGYGVAAGFTLLAAGWATKSFFKGRAEAERGVYQPAIETGQLFAKGDGIKRLEAMKSQDDVLRELKEIEKINKAVESSKKAESDGTQRLLESRTEPLEQLGGMLTAELFAPSLQRAAARSLKARLASMDDDRVSAKTLVEFAEATVIARRGFDGRDEAKALLNVIRRGETEAIAVEKLFEESIPEGTKAEPCEDPALTAAAESIEYGWLGLTDSSSPRCLEAPLRTFVALFEVDQVKREILDWSVERVSEEEVEDACLRLGRSIEQLEESTKGLKDRDKQDDLEQLRAFLTVRYPRIQELRSELRDGKAPAKDEPLDEFAAFLRGELKNLEEETSPGLALAEVEAARKAGVGLVDNRALRAVLKAGWGLYTETTSAAEFSALLSTADTACANPPDEEVLPMRVSIARAKTRILGSQFMKMNDQWGRFLARAAEAPAGEPAGDIDPSAWRTGATALRACKEALGGLPTNPSAIAMGIPELETAIISLAKESLEQAASLYAAGAETLELEHSRAILAQRNAFGLPSPKTDSVLAHAKDVFSRAKLRWDKFSSEQSNQAADIARWAEAHLTGLDSLSGADLAPLSAADLEVHRQQVAARAIAGIESEINLPLFESAREEVRKHAEQLAGYRVNEAVSKALKELTGDTKPDVFDDWYDGLLGRNGLDKTSLSSLTKLHGYLKEGERADALMEVIEDCQTRVLRTNSRLDPGLIGTLRETLRTFDRVRSPAARAKALLDLPEPLAQAPTNLEGSFAFVLRDQLIENQQRVLRDAYFADLDAKIKNTTRSKHLKTLWGDIEDPDDSDQLEAMQYMFGSPNGWYPEHIAGFSTRSLAGKGFNFRAIGDSDRTQPAKLEKIRRLDKFLQELNDYVASPPDTVLLDSNLDEIPLYMSLLAEPKLEFTISPSKRISSGANGGWNTFSGFACALLIDEDSSVDGNVGVDGFGSTIFRTKAVEEWCYGEFSDISMTFIVAADDKKVRWNTSSPLAPLHFWWLGSSSKGRSLGPSTGVFQLTLQEDTDVEFTIEFKTEPPLRPTEDEIPTNW